MIGFTSPLLSDVCFFHLDSIIMPLLVPPPTVTEIQLHGLPVDALVTSLKQEMSNWMKLCESNEEMKLMIEQTKAGQETSEGIRLDQSDVATLQEACNENVDVM